MENVDKRRDVKIVNSWEKTNRNHLGAQDWISKPNFHSLSIFSEDLVAIEMTRVKTCYNKPIYLGFCVLELSKWKMYNFHYGYMEPKFKTKLSLNYMDTDSFIYSIKTDDFYADIKNDIQEQFDTSDYPTDNIYNFPLVNKKVLGMMKDENCGKIMKEFVGLRSKMYSFSVQDQNDVKKSKGVKRAILDKYSLATYKNCLFNKTNVYDSMLTFKSKLHQIYTSELNKVVLSYGDDKRKIRSNNINTYAWYHFRIKETNPEYELDMLLDEIARMQENG